MIGNPDKHCSTVVLNRLNHRAACAAPLSFAAYWEMQLHQCSDLTVLGSRRSAKGSGLCDTSRVGRLVLDQCDELARYASSLDVGKHSAVSAIMSVVSRSFSCIAWESTKIACVIGWEKVAQMMLDLIVEQLTCLHSVEHGSGLNELPTRYSRWANVLLRRIISNSLLFVGSLPMGIGSCVWDRFLDEKRFVCHLDIDHRGRH